MKNKFWKSGEPFIWSTAAILFFVLILLGGLFTIVCINGMGVFWSKPQYVFQLKNGTKILGEIIKEEKFKSNEGAIKERIQIKRANRDINSADFVWVNKEEINSKEASKDIILAERDTNGNFVGFIKEFKTSEKFTGSLAEQWEEHQKRLKPIFNNADKLNARFYDLNSKTDDIKLALIKNCYQLKEQGVLPDNDNEKKIVKKIPEIFEIEHIFNNKIDINVLSEHNESITLLKKLILLNKESIVVKSDLEQQTNKINNEKVVLVDINGVEKTLAINMIVHLIYPNQLSFVDKSILYAQRLWGLFFDNPRESNTEGGLFPAIVGTVTLVFLMSFLSFPMGVIAGIYLREYAKEGFFIRMVRIAVNNLAGIPSIVYGIFGLGFFVYEIGSRVDTFFYPEGLDSPKFGTGGILWASLTLGILTVPVVIVSTEEALGTIPRDIRQGSLALGATKFQTLIGVLLPMASPGILTGFILAMSRATGEVAPLMLTGVMKVAPALPISSDWPFVHLDRKFMHLGFQIYDVGYQSPNVEASTPMVYVTTLLLLTIVFTLSLGAIMLRNRMKKRYTVKSF